MLATKELSFTFLNKANFRTISDHQVMIKIPKTAEGVEFIESFEGLQNDSIPIASLPEGRESATWDLIIDKRRLNTHAEAESDFAYASSSPREAAADSEG